LLTKAKLTYDEPNFYNAQGRGGAGEENAETGTWQYRTCPGRLLRRFSLQQMDPGSAWASKERLDALGYPDRPIAGRPRSRHRPARTSTRPCGVVDLPRRQGFTVPSRCRPVFTTGSLRLDCDPRMLQRFLRRAFQRTPAADEGVVAARAESGQGHIRLIRPDFAAKGLRWGCDLRWVGPFDEPCCLTRSHRRTRRRTQHRYRQPGGGVRPVAGEALKACSRASPGPVGTQGQQNAPMGGFCLTD